MPSPGRMQCEGVALFFDFFDGQRTVCIGYIPNFSKDYTEMPLEKSEQEWQGETHQTQFNHPADCVSFSHRSPSPCGRDGHTAGSSSATRCPATAASANARGRRWSCCFTEAGHFA
jgi:hypothetical protein